tara:strand:+ start:376 stop:552 length:177 start_codon:yes stop_codon:yes gene_type:complete
MPDIERSKNQTEQRAHVPVVIDNHDVLLKQIEVRTAHTCRFRPPKSGRGTEKTRIQYD